MNLELYFYLELNRPIEFENENPKPVVRVIKQNGLYIVYNIKQDWKKVSFNSASELLEALRSPLTSPDQFEDKTGENILKGK